MQSVRTTKFDVCLGRLGHGGIQLTFKGSVEKGGHDIGFLKTTFAFKAVSLPGIPEFSRHTRTCTILSLKIIRGNELSVPTLISVTSRCHVRVCCRVED